MKKVSVWFPCLSLLLGLASALIPFAAPKPGGAAEWPSVKRADDLATHLDQPGRVQANPLLLEFTGKIYPKRFLSVKGVPFGHHAIVWKAGRTADRALIEADLSDQEVADQLAAKGVPAGNNLSPHTWDARFDPKDPASDARVEGASLDVWVAWEGSQGFRNMAEMLGLQGADYRFGDHRQWIQVWDSGCIVCNVSCPGGKVSNHSLTIRDQAQGRLRPHMDLGRLPRDGTSVTVRLLRKAPIAAAPLSHGLKTR